MHTRLKVLPNSPVNITATAHGPGRTGTQIGYIHKLPSGDEEGVFQGLESEVSVGLLGSRHGLAIYEGGACYLEAWRNHNVVDGATRSRSITINEAGTVAWWRM